LFVVVVCLHAYMHTCMHSGISPGWLMAAEGWLKEWLLTWTAEVFWIRMKKFFSIRGMKSHRGRVRPH